MSKIINPAGYPVDITVQFDPITGNTELRVSNRGRTPIEMIKVAALLCEHGAKLLASILQGKTKLEPAINQHPTTHNANNGIGGEHA